MASQVERHATRATARGGRLRALLIRSGLALVILSSVVPALLLLRPWLGSNLGVVDPGRVIRAAQPTRELPRLIQEYHLSSILNLRGGSPVDWWYTAEVRAAKASGVTFFDLPMSAVRRPSRRELLLLIDVLERCSCPLLIHCKSGADRTGLAAAIYLMVRRGVPPQQALCSFSIFYSHVPLFGPEHLHEPLNEYAAWLESNALAHSPQRFRNWVKNQYRADDPAVDPPPLPPGPRHPL
jgi:hypothetical protein